MDIRRTELLDEIPLAEIGAPAELFPVETGRGHGSQFVWLESMGIFMSESLLHVARGGESRGIKRLASRLLLAMQLPAAYRFGHLRNAKRDLFCMTRADAHGKIVWRQGKTSDRPDYCSHMGNNLLRIADIDGDGREEIVAICAPGQIGVFELATGRMLRDARLPSDNFATIRLAKTGPRPGDWTILAAVSEMGYAPHTYSNPVLLLDPALRILAEYDLSGGAGHEPAVFDADGDGLDEILVGYTLIDHDGRVRWVAEGFEDAARVDATRMHADHTVVVPGYRPGLWTAAIAGSDRMYLFDQDGRRVFEHAGEHPQYLFHGRLHPETDESHLFLLNCRISMELIDMQGRSVWRGRLPANWPVGRPRTVCGDDLFHMGVPGSLWRNPAPQGKDIIVYSEAGWPYGINGVGDRVLELPCPPAARQPEYDIPPRHRPDDYGYGYRTCVADIDGDGQEEILVFDRRFLWTYRISS